MGRRSRNALSTYYMQWYVDRPKSTRSMRLRYTAIFDLLIAFTPKAWWQKRRRLGFKPAPGTPWYGSYR
jgi:hypothetical protein